MTEKEAIEKAQKEWNTSNYIAETTLYPGVRKVHENRCAWLLTLLNLARKAISTREENQWIPVTERLPESEKCVLVRSKNGGVAEGKYNARLKEWTQFRWTVTELQDVTHWMPLPTPPKEPTP